MPPRAESEPASQRGALRVLLAAAAAAAIVRIGVILAISPHGEGLAGEFHDTPGYLLMLRAFREGDLAAAFPATYGPLVVLVAGPLALLTGDVTAFGAVVAASGIAVAALVARAAARCGAGAAGVAAVAAVAVLDPCAVGTSTSLLFDAVSAPFLVASIALAADAVPSGSVRRSAAAGALAGVAALARQVYLPVAVAAGLLLALRPAKGDAGDARAPRRAALAFVAGALLAALLWFASVSARLGKPTLGYVGYETPAFAAIHAQWKDPEVRSREMLTLDSPEAEEWLTRDRTAAAGTRARRLAAEGRTPAETRAPQESHALAAARTVVRLVWQSFAALGPALAVAGLAWLLAWTAGSRPLARVAGDTTVVLLGALGWVGAVETRYLLPVTFAALLACAETIALLRRDAADASPRASRTRVAFAVAASGAAVPFVSMAARGLLDVPCVVVTVAVAAACGWLAHRRPSAAAWVVAGALAAVAVVDAARQFPALERRIRLADRQAAVVDVAVPLASSGARPVVVLCPIEPNVEHAGLIFRRYPWTEPDVLADVVRRDLVHYAVWTPDLRHPTAALLRLDGSDGTWTAAGVRVTHLGEARAGDAVARIYALAAE